MKILSKIVLILSFLLCLLPHLFAEDNSPKPLVYVIVFARNEDPSNPLYPNFIDNKKEYVHYRNRILKLSKVLNENKIPWSLQTEWNFLEGVLKYEVREKNTPLLSKTDGLNIISYLKKRGVEIDPSSSEDYGYNYADIAYLIHECGEEPASVVARHTLNPKDNISQSWIRFIEGIYGKKYGSKAFFQPKILTGTDIYKRENEIVSSCVWRPKSKDDFFADNPIGNLMVVGQYGKDMLSLKNLLSKIQSGELPNGKMYTTCIFIDDNNLDKDMNFNLLISNSIKPLVKMREQGLIQLVYLEDVPKIWKERYNEEGFVYGPYY